MALSPRVRALARPLVVSAAATAFALWAWAATGHLGYAARATPIWYWPPLVGAATLLALTGLFGAAAGWRAPPDSATQPAPKRPLWDVLAVAGLVIAGLAVQLWWVRTANPAWALVGMDHASYAENVLAIARGRWEDYNVDKPILHPYLCVWVSKLTGDVARAAVWVSLVSVALLPALAWAAARSLYGPLAALVVGVFVLGDAETWSYSIQATSYGLYAALVTATIAAATAWSVRGGWFFPVLVGIGSALTMATSEKAIVTVGPPLLLIAAARLLRPGTRLRELGAVALAGVSFVGLSLALQPKTPYTPIGNLVANQRVEMHVAVPYSWPSVRQLDPRSPYPGVERVPAFIRAPRLDLAISALLAPNDVDVLRLDTTSNRLGIAPGTSLAPDRILYASNVHELFESRALTPTRLLVVAAGTVGSALSTGTAPALAVATAIGSGVPPLHLKYQPRYYLHLLPLGWILLVGGLDTLARAAAGRSRAGGVLGRVTMFGLGGTLLVAIAQKDDGLWMGRSRLRWPPPAALATGAAVDIGNAGAGVRALADALQSTPPGPVHDCTPLVLAAYLPLDRVGPARRGDRVCERPADAPTGTLAVVSEHGGGPPGTGMRPSTLMSAGWLPVTADGRPTMPGGVQLMRKQ